MTHHINRWTCRYVAVVNMDWAGVIALGHVPGVKGTLGGAPGRNGWFVE